jgi:hypothetical protein
MRMVILLKKKRQRRPSYTNDWLFKFFQIVHVTIWLVTLLRS